ncbi:MAG: hypothetical protein IPN29_08345 [Saprospiraceae bacterium]|nr:hypothetical protein [Saprospiraceae bacterium]
MWNVLNSGLLSNATATGALFDDVGNLYVCGNGGLPYHLAKWNGTAWSDIGQSSWHSVSTMEFDENGNLYAAWGEYDYGTSQWIYGISKYEGTSWTLLGMITGNNGVIVNDILCQHDTIYIGGYFNNVGGVSANGIAKYANNTWTNLGAGLQTESYGITNGGTVHAMDTTSTGALIIGGYFTLANGVPCSNLVRYENGSWNTTLFAGHNLDIYDILVSPLDTIYIAGYNQYPSSLSPVKKWSGTSWIELGDWSQSTYVKDLEFDILGNMYCVGYFTNAGGTAADGIAKWNGQYWYDTGAGVLGGYPEVITSDGNGSFAIGGSMHNYGTGLHIAGIFTPDNSPIPPPSKFRTINDGNWSNLAVWERYDNTSNSWAAASAIPDFKQDSIIIAVGDTINCQGQNLGIDQLHVYGSLTNVNQMTVLNGPGDDLVINGNVYTSTNNTYNFAAGAHVVINGLFHASGYMNNINITIGIGGALYVGPSGNCLNYYQLPCPCSGLLDFTGTIINYGIITVSTGGLYCNTNYGAASIINHGDIVYTDPVQPTPEPCPACCPGFGPPIWSGVKLDNHGDFYHLGEYELTLLGAPYINRPSGRIYATDGDLVFRIPGDTIGGNFYVASGRTLSITDYTQNFVYPTQFNGNGHLRVQPGQGVTPHLLFKDSVTFNVPTIFVANGGLFYGTIFGGNGSLTIPSGSVLDLMGVSWTDSTDLYIMPGATLNFPPASFFAWGGVSFTSGVTIHNQGVINNTNIGLGSGFTLNNHGVLNMNSNYFGNTTAQPNWVGNIHNFGTLNLGGGGEFPIIGSVFHQHPTGNIHIHPNSFLSRYGNSTWDGGTTLIDTLGAINLITGSHQLFNETAFNGKGTLNFSNGVAQFTGPSTINCKHLVANSGPQVNSLLTLGSYCTANFMNNPVTGSGKIYNYGFLTGNTTIMPDSVVNFGTTSPGLASFATLGMTPQFKNHGRLLFEVNNTQNDLLNFTSTIHINEGLLEIKDTKNPSFAIGDQRNIINNIYPTSVFDDFIGCFDTIFNSPVALSIKKEFEDAIACADPYDTLLIHHSVSAVPLEAPLMIDKPLTIMDNNPPNAQLFFDFSLPGFNGSTYGFLHDDSQLLSFQNLDFVSHNSPANTPIILNEGMLELMNLTIKDASQIPQIKNTGNGTINFSGTVVIKQE